MPGTRHAVLVTCGEPPHPSFAEQLVYSGIGTLHLPCLNASSALAALIAETVIRA